MDIDIKNGNVIDELKKIPDESVDCIVSSPPYYGLRDYSGVATYTDGNYHNLIRIASMDLQKHRNNALEIHREKYYLTEPVFNKKDQKWYVSLKYDMSSIWGGNPDCEHEWEEYSEKLYNGRGDAQNSALYSKQSDIPSVEINNSFCSKCGAWKGQLGIEPTYQMYVEHLMLVMKELKRVLKKTGTLWWNMGDSYASSGGPTRHFGYSDPKWDKARNGSFEEPTAFDQGIEPKSLMGIPEEFMRKMLKDRWVLRNKLQWNKRNAMPSSKQDGFTPKWEYVYFFTKRSKSYYFDLDSIRKPLEESSIKRISQKNIPNQFKSGKSFDFAETNPVNNIPKILNNMHKKYDYTELRKDFSKYPKDEYGQKANIGNYLSIQKRRNRSYIEAEILYPDDPQKQKDYIKNVHDHSDNLNGANPGDILFDDTIYDLYSDPNIQDAFIEYLERERPELLMPSILDIPTMPHSFAHFAVMPETLVEPLMKAGCAPEVCIKCGKPKVLQHTRIEKTGNEKPMSGKHATNPSVNSPGNREHYYTEVRKYDVDQKEIATFIKEHLPKEKMPILDDKFGETKWKHWIRTDESGASLPSPSEYAELKEILALPDDHDEEMLSTVTVLIDDSGNSNIPIGLKPSCNCNAGFKPGVVIDPFAGSGTVGVVAKKQGKSAILIEINPEYVEIIKSRLEIEGSGINTNVKFVDVASIESMEEDE